MRVRIVDELLADRHSWLALDRIVDALFDEDHPAHERHLWDIEDLDALLASAWLQPPDNYRARNTREIAERSFMALATVPTGRKAHAQSIIVTNSKTADATGRRHLSPSDAVRVLREPLQIVVENSISDGEFLQTMAKVFGHSDLLFALGKRWCVFLHAGGSGELFKRVEECLRTGAVPWRVCVITDGDRLSPTVPIDPRAKELRNKCQASAVTCFVLHKRDSENYLPVEVLALSQTGPLLTTFCRLTQEQRDHFDMKKGFRERPASDSAYNGLYADLADARREALTEGFGKRVGELFETKRSDFRRQDVEKACNTCPDELPTLLDALESML